MEQGDVRAHPVTAVIAGRVRALRESARMSGSVLAAEMANLGIPWNRTTVAKLETGRRESVTVQELLALAVVLDVPAVWLLADPAAETPSPIAAGVERDPWPALMWMIGKEPLTDRPGTPWGAAALPMRWACQVATLVERFREVRTGNEISAAVLPGKERARQDEDERRVLRTLAAPLRRLRDLSFPAPALPADVLDRARELDVDLSREG